MASFNPIPAGDAMTPNANKFDPDFNPQLNLEDYLLENVNQQLPFAPSYPDIGPYSNPTFEDPFSYPATGPYRQNATGFGNISGGPHAQQPIATTATTNTPTTPTTTATANSNTTAAVTAFSAHQAGPAGPAKSHAFPGGRASLHHIQYPGIHHRNAPTQLSICHSHAHPTTDENVSSPQDPDDKLLSFNPPAHFARIADDATGRIADAAMTAELYGMFFVAEDVFAPPEGTGGDTTPVSAGGSSANNNNNSISHNNPHGATPAGGAPASPAQGSAGPKPPELTCYRRNLWQCSGSVTLPRHTCHLVDELGIQHPILELAASISAVESIDGKATEIISVPWKSSASTSSHPQPHDPSVLVAVMGAGESPRSATAPPNIPLDLGAGETSVSEDGMGVAVTIPVTWKRLQFKHATANNGRRKGLQQYYMVKIGLLARVIRGGQARGINVGGSSATSGEWMRVAEISSGAVIVRGRSPRNFDSRKDVPLAGSVGKMERPGTSGSVAPEKSGTATVTWLSCNATADMVQIPTESDGGVGGICKHSRQLSQSSSTSGYQWQQLQKQKAQAQAQAHVQTPSNEWATAQPFNVGLPSPHSNKKMALSMSGTRPPIPSWGPDSGPSAHAGGVSGGGSGGGSGSGASRPNITPTLPISLSLSEDERTASPTQRSVSLGGGNVATSRERSGSGAAGGLAVVSGGGAASVHSPTEEADLLYEYFPLSLDDWSPPVDAIYRPHVVHSQTAPPDVASRQSINKRKIYFSAD